MEKAFKNLRFVNKKKPALNETNLNAIIDAIDTIDDRVIDSDEKKLSIDGDSKDNVVTFSQASIRANIVSGESHKTLFGKISKWLADLKNVAFTGSYTDLINKPTIGNGKLTIQKNGTNVQTFTANQTSDATANIEVPTKLSELENDTNFLSESGGEISDDDKAMLITPSGIKGDDSQSLTDFYKVEADSVHGIVLYCDNEDTDERYLQTSGDNAMQGDLNMNGYNIKSGNKEIDLKDQSFELGIRESTGGSWDSHINIDEGVVNIESTNIDLIGGGARLKISDKNFNLSNSDNSIYSSNESLHIDSYNNIDLLARNEGHINLTAADEISFFISSLSNKHLFNISSVGRFELLAKNGINIESGNNSIYIKMPNNHVFEIKSADMFRIYSNEYKLYCHPEDYSQPHEFFRISKSGKTTFTPPKALDVYANNDIRIGTAGRIDLFPGTSSVSEIPSTNFAVRTGNLEGKIFTDGSKPSIKNYGNIEMYDEIDYEGYLLTINSEHICFSNYNIDDEYYFNILTIDSVGLEKSGDIHIVANHVGGSTNLVVEHNAFTPWYNSIYNLGKPSTKWNNVYAQNGTIQTSDRNEKNTIEELSEEQAKNLILGLRPATYKMNDGTSNRTHWGIISQDLEELLESLGMSSTDFAGFIKSPKVRVITEDENGNPLKQPIEEVIEGEYTYSLRYDEFIAPLIKMVQMQQVNIQKLEEQIKTIQQ